MVELLDILLYPAFFIPGNGINKGSLKRGSPVEQLGVQTQKNPESFLHC